MVGATRAPIGERLIKQKKQQTPGYEVAEKTLRFLFRWEFCFFIALLLFRQILNELLIGKRSTRNCVFLQGPPVAGAITFHFVWPRFFEIQLRITERV